MKILKNEKTVLKIKFKGTNTLAQKTNYSRTKLVDCLQRQPPPFPAMCSHVPLVGLSRGNISFPSRSPGFLCWLAPTECGGSDCRSSSGLNPRTPATPPSLLSWSPGPACRGPFWKARPRQPQARWILMKPFALAECRAVSDLSQYKVKNWPRV